VNVARAGKQFESKLIFLSTDYVFDGNKPSPYETNDPRAPQSVYGASKAEAEVQVLKIMPETCIVRTSWVFGAGGRCFPETILKLAFNKSEIDVVTDQRGCPTYTVDLARAIIHLCRNNAQGIVHTTNQGDCTWFEFAQEIVAAAFLCSGQRCTALSRVIVDQSQADQLCQRLVTHMEKIRVGNGLDPQNTMGPLVSRQQLETVTGYVRKGLAEPSSLIVGGRQLAVDPDREGYFYAPTLFDHVSPTSALAQDEIFGPVLPIIRVRNAEEAFDVANGTRYGLAASLFTGNRHLVDQFVERVESGMVHINHGTSSQPHVPFGGVKDSGQGAFSIGPTSKEAFTNVKTVYIKW